jgi:ComF family protein
LSAIKKSLLSKIFLLALRDYLQTLFFPKECVICKKVNNFICPNCLATLPIRPSAPPEKIRHQDYLDQVHIASFYAHPALATLINLYKFHYQESLGKILAQLLIYYIKKNQLQTTLSDFILIPLPLHNRRLLERGFNQSEILAQVLATHLKLPLVHDCLRRTRYTKHQTLLNQNKRQKNISGVFSIIDNQTIIGKKILLIDDVVTTGASLNEAAKILRQNGAIKVIGLALAKN